jgi:carbonic anhydrase
LTTPTYPQAGQSGTPCDKLLTQNRAWVAERLAEDPEYFARLSATHEPHFLWIGCSDARVPANVVTGTSAGEMFVHRNIANQVHPTDSNLAAVIQYAVEVLKVKDIIVCGHADCGGVKAALAGHAPSGVELWISQLRTIARLHADELEQIVDPQARLARLVELNVSEQVHNLGRHPVIQAAWAAGAELRVHGWVYDIRDGRLRDLEATLHGTECAAESQQSASMPGNVGVRQNGLKRAG